MNGVSETGRDSECTDDEALQQGCEACATVCGGSKTRQLVVSIGAELLSLYRDNQVARFGAVREDLFD